MIKFSDSPKSDGYWARIREELPEDTVKALRELYSIYDTELVEWFANLYEPKIGGFYYSNSARDNETTVYEGKEYRLLPDAESTCQALGFVSFSGIGDGLKYPEFLPKWMRDDIADFIYGLQDVDGYFYHPQWGKDITVSRRSRDFNWCRDMLLQLGREKRYKTILDLPADNHKEEVTLIPEHLKSEKAFIEYLDGMDIPNKSYHAGNTLIAQVNEIESRGYLPMLIDYLNSLQHPEVGHWHTETSYYAVNGVMKLSGLYMRAGRVIPNSDKTSMAVIDAISSEVPISGIVELWNTWIAIYNINQCLIKSGGTEEKLLSEKIMKTLRADAARAIMKSAEKVRPFKKSDHAFSYGKDFSSRISQGAPVAFDRLPEGDVNATVIASSSMVRSVFNALGIYELMTPLYGKEEGKMFLDIIENNRKRK